MDIFLETCNLPRLTHEEIENPNTLITSKKIESVIKESPRPDDFTGKVYQISKDKLTPIFFKFFKILKEHT